MVQDVVVQRFNDVVKVRTCVGIREGGHMKKYFRQLAEGCNLQLVGVFEQWEVFVDHVEVHGGLCRVKEDAEERGWRGKWSNGNSTNDEFTPEGIQLDLYQETPAGSLGDLCGVQGNTFITLGIVYIALSVLWGTAPIGTIAGFMLEL